MMAAFAGGGGGGGGCPYEQNGLVFWLDGKVGASATEWVEQIGGMVFANNGCLLLPDGYSFDGSNYLRSNDSFAYTGENLTIEAVFETAASHNTVYYVFSYLGSAKGNPCLLFNEQYSLAEYTQGTVAYSFKPDAAVKTSVSFSADNGLANGNSLSKAFADSNGANAEFEIGNAPSASRRFKGNIHCIRIYNRKLTQQEALSNLAVDNARFNLGLNI